IREGDGGVGSGRPRPLERADSPSASHSPLHGQAPPGKRLREGRCELQERGGEEGIDGAVDRHKRDYRSRRLERLLGGLSASVFTHLRGRRILRSSANTYSQKFR